MGKRTSRDPHERLEGKWMRHLASLRAEQHLLSLQFLAGSNRDRGKEIS